MPSTPERIDLDRCTLPLASDAVSLLQAAAWLGSATANFVWRNEGGGLTFSDDHGDRYLTWVPDGTKNHLLGAIRRSNWVRPYVAAPCFGGVRDGAGGAWAVSTALPGASAVGSWGREHPLQATEAIAAGLRRLHDAAPVAQCPFRMDMTARLISARERLTKSCDWRVGLHGYFDSWTTRQALDVLDAGAGDLDPVVCHGDPCSPNYLVDEQGQFTGIVDLGDLGVADRWFDLAIASWSLSWNFGPGFEEVFFDRYGIARDERKIRFYRLLW